MGEMARRLVCTALCGRDRTWVGGLGVSWSGAENLVGIYMMDVGFGLYLADLRLRSRTFLQNYIIFLRELLPPGVCSSSQDS